MRCLKKEGGDGEFKFQPPWTQPAILHPLIQSHNKHLHSLPFNHCLHTMERSRPPSAPPGRAPLSRSRTRRFHRRLRGRPPARTHARTEAQARVDPCIDKDVDLDGGPDGVRACTGPRCCPLQMYSETEDGANDRSRGGFQLKGEHARSVPCTDVQNSETPVGRCTFPPSSRDLGRLLGSARHRPPPPASHVGSHKNHP